MVHALVLVGISVIMVIGVIVVVGVIVKTGAAATVVVAMVVFVAVVVVIVCPPRRLSASPSRSVFVDIVVVLAAAAAAFSVVVVEVGAVVVQVLSPHRLKGLLVDKLGNLFDIHFLHLWPDFVGLHLVNGVCGGIHSEDDSFVEVSHPSRSHVEGELPRTFASQQLVLVVGVEELLVVGISDASRTLALVHWQEGLAHVFGRRNRVVNSLPFCFGPCVSPALPSCSPSCPHPCRQLLLEVDLVEGLHPSRLPCCPWEGCEVSRMTMEVPRSLGHSCRGRCSTSLVFPSSG